MKIRELIDRAKARKIDIRVREFADLRKGHEGHSLVAIWALGDHYSEEIQEFTDSLGGPYCTVTRTHMLSVDEQGNILHKEA